MTRGGAEFGYRIRPCAAGWSWTAFDAGGRVQERGEAPTKAIAAALVIRAIARRTVADQSGAGSKAA